MSIEKTLTENNIPFVSGYDNVMKAIKGASDGSDIKLCSGYRVFPDGAKCNGCSDCNPVKIGIALHASTTYIDKPCTIEEWRSKAEALWQLLDDIDTASDIFKPEQTNFYKYIMEKAGKRGKYLISDGYNLFAI